MPLKNTVALERRVDLASLFCMIGRHGPAVALALVAMVFLLVCFRIYWSFREKRMKGAAAADHSGSNAGERDAALGLWEHDEPRAEETRRYTGSTDGSDESSPDDLKEDTYLSHRPLKVRRRRAAAERTPYKDKLPDIKYMTSLDKTENAFVWDVNSHKAAGHHAEEVSHSLESDYMNKMTKDFIEEACGTKEPELINDVSCKEEEKVLEAESSEDIITTNEDASGDEWRQDESTNLFTLNNQLCFTQPPELSGNNDVKVDNILATETKSLEPHLEKLEDDEKQTKVGTSDDIVSVITNEDVNVETSHAADSPDLSSDGLQQQQETSPTSEAEIDQNGVCLLVPSLHETKGQSDERDTPVDQTAVDEMVLQPQDVNTTEEESEDHHKTVEPLTFEHDTSSQHEQCLEIVHQVDEGSLTSDQKDNVDEKQQPIFTNNENNVLPETADLLSSTVDSCHEECITPTDAIKEETCNDFEAEISSIPDFPEVLSNGQKQLIEWKDHETSADLDKDAVDIVVASPLPSEILVPENDEKGQKDENNDTFEACSTVINDNVAFNNDNQSVAETIVLICEGSKKDEDQQSALQAESESLRSEQNTFSQQEQLDQLTVLPVQDSENTDCDNLAIDEDIETLNEGVIDEKHDEDIETLNEGVIDEKQGDSEDGEAQVKEEICKTDSGPELSDLVKVESEHETGITTSNALEQKEPERESDTDIDISKEIQAESNENGCHQEVTDDAFTSNVQMICDGESKDGNISHSEKQTFSQTNQVFDNSCVETTVEEANSTQQISAGQDCKDIDETVAHDTAITTASTVMEDMSQPDMPSSSQDQKHAENNLLFEMTSAAAPFITQDNDLPVQPNQLLTLEPIELEENGLSSPGLAGESGISSMTVSPDLEEASEEISAIVIGHLPLECDPTLLPHDTLVTCTEFMSEEQENKSCSSFIDDAACQVTKEDPVTMIFGPSSISPVQLSPPENQDISDVEVLATNEDAFGSEIEESHRRAMDEFVSQVVDNILTIKDEVKKQTEQMFNKIDKKKEQACVVKKEEEEQAEDGEKTEISIMEATMDHNEWITDGNSQVLPWMNVSCFSKDSSSKESTDILTLVEDKPTASTPIPEENTENAKKVLAVQPMPQNVNVTFRVHYLTLSPYQTVAVTGDQQELGSWKSVVPLERTKDGYWSCVVSLPVESHVEWKFVVLDKGEVCRWEECGNRLLHTGYGDDLLVHKWWGFL